MGCVEVLIIRLGMLGMVWLSVHFLGMQLLMIPTPALTYLKASGSLGAQAATAFDCDDGDGGDDDGDYDVSRSC